MTAGNRPELRVIVSDLVFPESPRWRSGRLWVSDWGAHEVHALDLEGGDEVVARIDSFPMCIDHLPDGRLLVVSSRDRRVLRRQADGSLVTHADLGSIDEHAWNDIVVDGRGNAYVNNIGFDFPGGEFAPGLVALITPDGAARKVADGLAFPNGMAVTPDNATLIVAESYGQTLTAFDIAADGDLSNRRTWAEVDDHPDGICLDADGCIWASSAAMANDCARIREGGEVLERIDLGRSCFATMLGGPDRRTLFMLTADWGGTEGVENVIKSRTGQVLALEAPAPGVGWP